jgi:esterase/lipase
MTASSAGRRIFKAAAIGSGGLLLLLLAGPRVDMDTTLRPSLLPETPHMDGSQPWPGARILEGYLARTEARFPDLVPGTEKTIVWADPENPSPTEYAVIYLHGFSASRQEVAPLARILARSLGANLFLARLRGHGRGPEAMAEGSVNAWVHDGVEALEIGSRLGRRIVLMGTSTGGTLAVWLAAEAGTPGNSLPEMRTVESLFLISPNFGPRNPAAELLLWPWGAQIARLTQGPQRCWEPHNEEQGRFWTTCYPTEALLPMMGLVALARGIDPAALDVPTFVFFSPDDEVVEPERTREWYEELASPWKAIMEVRGGGDPSHHVLAGDILAPDRTEWMAGLMAEFLRGVDLPAAQLHSKE